MRNIEDLMQTDGNGHGIVNILAVDKLLQLPRLYPIFLLWMLSALFEHRHEGAMSTRQGWYSSLIKPICCLLTRRALLQEIDQVVQLIRSIGVGVYFVTQNPIDIPDTVLDHSATEFSMRCAFTPRAIAKQWRRQPKLSGQTRSTM